jgi:hypothetical protein
MSRATHLSEAEFIELLDGTLDAERRRHVDRCEPCAAQVAALAASAEAASDIAIPEPPPFFWAQLSARVSDAVAKETASPRSAAMTWARASWLGAAVAAAVLVVSIFVARQVNQAPAVSPGAAVETTANAHPDDGRVDDAVDLDTDEAWALVRSLAADLDEEQMDAEGVSPGAGAAEHLALQLTDAERTELARLLEEQLRRNSPPDSAS